MVIVVAVAARERQAVDGDGLVAESAVAVVGVAAGYAVTGDTLTRPYES